MSELCDRYQISRPTGYKWVDRIEAEGLKAVSHRFVRRRRYRSELDSLGFAPCLGDLTPATTALESLRATRRLGGSPVRVRSARRIGEGDRSIFHCLEVSGTGKSRSESFVFVVPRSGEGPVCPVVVLTNPTGGRSYGALAPLARAKIKGEPLRIPPWLVSRGISFSLSESGRDLEEVLSPRDLECLADGAQCGFSLIEITRDAVVLTVAKNHGSPIRQLDFARRWLR
jgi:hypothetical protein